MCGKKALCGKKAVRLKCNLMLIVELKFMILIHLGMIKIKIFTKIEAVYKILNKVVLRD